MTETVLTAITSRSRPLHAMSIDVEDYFHAENLARTLDRSQWEGMPSRVDQNTRLILDILAADPPGGTPHSRDRTLAADPPGGTPHSRDRTLATEGIRGTFFILGWVAERHPALVRAIHAAGHEVASHGWDHRLIYTQTPDAFREDAARAKGFLEDLIGEPVLGYRAPCFSIVEQSLWALDILKDLGFVYDSSIMPTAHDRYGLAGASPSVHRHANGLLEIPPSTTTFGPLRVPFGGGGYFRFYPYWLTRWCFDRAEAAGRPVVTYFHPWEFDPGQPRIAAAWPNRVRQYTNLDKVEGRFRDLCRRYAFAPMRELFRDALCAPAQGSPAPTAPTI